MRAMDGSLLRSRLWARGASAIDVLIVLVAVLAFHWRAARPGWALAGGDLRYFFLAVREAVSSALREGRLPLWERGIFLGYPLVGDPQAAVFDFTTWLTLPWDAARGLTIGTLLHLGLMAIGMHVWMRTRGLGRAEALLAAVLFSLGAKQTVHLHHWNLAAATAWWPWMMAGVDGFVSSGRGGWLVLVVGAIAGCWFGGSPQMAFFGVLLAGTFALFQLPVLWRRRRREVALLLCAFVLGVAIAMPGILPAAELARYGPRGGSGPGYDFAAAYAWPDRYGLALLLLPGAFGGPAWTSTTNLWEATGYVGILPIALAAAAPARRRGIPFFAVGAALGIWLSFGRNAWLDLHHLLYGGLPGFGLFRVPTRGLMVTSLCVSVLAAEGLHHLVASHLTPRRLVRVAGVLVAVIVAVHVLPRLPSFSLDRASAAAFAWRASALATLGLLWVRVVRREGLRPRWAWAMCCFCWIDLYGAFGRGNTVLRADTLTPAFAPIRAAIPAERGSRVAVATESELEYDEPQRVRFESPTGYGPSIIDRVRRVVEWTRVGVLDGDASANQLIPRGDPGSARWRLLATRTVVAGGPPSGEHLAVMTKNGPRVLDAVDALPRVYWTGAFMQHGDPGIEPLLEVAIRGDRAVLADLPPCPSGEPSGPVAAEELDVGPRSLSATVTAPRDGIAVILDPWFPGWSASVDGTPVPIVRANYAFQAVPIQAGRHRIALTYESQPLKVGLVIALLGAAGAALLCRAARPITPAGGRPS